MHPIMYAGVKARKYLMTESLGQYIGPILGQNPKGGSGGVLPTGKC